MKLTDELTMVPRHICVAVDTTADVGLVGWAVGNVLRVEDELHMVKARMLSTLCVAGCTRPGTTPVLAVPINRRCRRGSTLQACHSLTAKSMYSMRRLAKTRRRRCFTPPERLRSSSGSVLRCPRLAAQTAAHRSRPLNQCPVNDVLTGRGAKSSVRQQVPEQRVMTMVLPTHMAAPSAGASIVIFADTGFFRLLVVGSRSTGAISRCTDFVLKLPPPTTAHCSAAQGLPL